MEDFDLQDIKKKLNIHGTLNDIETNDFPCFYPVDKIIILIDGCLNTPFYERDETTKNLKNHEFNECLFDSNVLTDLNFDA